MVRGPLVRCSIKCTQQHRFVCFVFRNLEQALAEFHPDIVVYNAGTDVLEGDSLGLLSISEQVTTTNVAIKISSYKQFR